MDHKLTLKLNGEVIEKAKLYAQKKDTSLSKLIEAYLQFLTNSKNDHDDITPLVKSLSGILDLPKTTNYKDSYKKHLGEKYSK